MSQKRACCATLALPVSITIAGATRFSLLNNFRYNSPEYLEALEARVRAGVSFEAALTLLKEFDRQPPAPSPLERRISGLRLILESPITGEHAGNLLPF